MGAKTMNEKGFKITKWTYSAGGIGRDMAYTLVSIFLITYIQYTMKLTQAQFTGITTIIVICRIWDAIFDPMMGTIIENTNFKYGKFKPWILIGAAANSIFIALLFAFRVEGWAYVVFFGIAYLIWGMTFSINDISYWSMLPALTSEAKERSQITTMVVAFATIGAILAAGITPILVSGDAIKRYGLIGIGVSIFFLCCSFMTGICTKEHIRVESKEKISLKKMFDIIKCNDQLVIMAIVVMLYSLGNSLMIAFGFNFFTFEYGYSIGGNKLFLFTVTYALATLGAQLSFGIINKKLNRRQILDLAILLVVLGNLALMAFGYFIPKIDLLLYMIGFITFFGQGIFYVAILIMLTNTIEYNEYRTGKRYESIVFSLRPFMVKFATAIQQGILTAVLIISGIYMYSLKIAQLEQLKGKGLISSEKVLTQADAIVNSSMGHPQMLVILRIGMAIVPLILICLGYILTVKRYKIDEKVYIDMLEVINARKESMLSIEEELR
jgi:sugar (glycoside-pentoside-hexuronide) transporter